MNKSGFEKIKAELKRHISDSTAMVSVANPVNACLETMVVGMSDEVSLKSRLIGTAVTYAGLGSLTKIRDLSKRKLRITKDSPEYVKGLHDFAFAATLIFGIRPAIYLMSGESDWKKIGMATFFSTLATGAMAYPLGYAVDNYREIYGISESGRLPKFIAEKPKPIQKTAIAAFTAASVGFTGLVYLLNNQ